MPGEKATNNQYDQRVREVMEMIIEGRPRYDICQYVLKKWEKGPWQADRYAKAARLRLQRLHDKTDAERIAQSSARYDNIYRKAIKAEQFTSAVSAVRAQDDLFGNQAPKRLAIEHSTVDVDLDELIDEADKVLGKK